MAFAYCPDCGARIYLGRKPWIGQSTVCDSCDADLEVVRLSPPELDWVDNLVDFDPDQATEAEYQEA
jgi:lysine biosynthesis protein LysW